MHLWWMTHDIPSDRIWIFHFSYYWPFVWGICWLPLNTQHKGQVVYNNDGFCVSSLDKLLNVQLISQCKEMVWGLYDVILPKMNTACKCFFVYTCISMECIQVMGCCSGHELQHIITWLHGLLVRNCSDCPWRMWCVKLQLPVSSSCMHHNRECVPAAVWTTVPICLMVIMLKPVAKTSK